MRRSFLGYTRLLLVPLLAVGLILTGCDSSGSNGGDDGENGASTVSYPTSGSYDEEIVSNLLTSDLRGKIDGAVNTSVSEATLTDLYTGDIDDKTIAAASGITTDGQSTYDDIAGDVDLSSTLSVVNTPLAESAALESTDSPDPGNPVTTDDLVRFYFTDVANNDRFTTPNGIHMGQLSEKLLASAIYSEAARILTEFETGNVSADDAAEKWDEAFGYYGAPRDFEASFLDLDNPEGLVDGSSSQDVDGSGGVDLTTEFVYTWAGYSAERAAASQSTGNLNNFAGRAFEAFREGRKAIENDNLDELSGPDGYAATARDAWEETVAVNVIHYINSMRGDLNDDNTDVSEGDFSEDAWGEAKAFAWGLQFYSRDALSSGALNSVLRDIGNDPPYGEMSEGDYRDALQSARSEIADAYEFNPDNVGAW